MVALKALFREKGLLNVGAISETIKGTSLRGSASIDVLFVKVRLAVSAVYRSPEEPRKTKKRVHKVEHAWRVETKPLKQSLLNLAHRQISDNHS